MKKKAKAKSKNLVAIIMGSRSDWDTMRNAAEVLDEFEICYEVRVLSAHRSPDETARFAKQAARKGLRVIIAGAGGAAHLSGTVAAHSLLPVIGVPVQTRSLKGLDSLLSTVQMPSGVPVATMAIGSSGAKNAAILALQILGIKDPRIQKKLDSYRKRLAQKSQMKP